MVVAVFRAGGQSTTTPGDAALGDGFVDRTLGYFHMSPFHPIALAALRHRKRELARQCWRTLTAQIGPQRRGCQRPLISGLPPSEPSMSEPSISVTVPSYNRSASLAELLAAIVAQLHDGDELISSTTRRATTRLAGASLRALQSDRA